MSLAREPKDPYMFTQEQLQTIAEDKEALSGLLQAMSTSPSAAPSREMLEQLKRISANLSLIFDQFPSNAWESVDWSSLDQANNHLFTALQEYFDASQSEGSQTNADLLQYLGGHPGPILEELDTILRFNHYD